MKKAAQDRRPSTNYLRFRTTYLPCLECVARSHLPPQHVLSAFAEVLASPPQHFPSLQQSAPSLQHDSPLPSRAHILPSAQHFPSLQQSMALPFFAISLQHAHAALLSAFGAGVVAVWAIIAKATINIITSTNIFDFTIASLLSVPFVPQLRRCSGWWATEVATHVAWRGLDSKVGFERKHRPLVTQARLQKRS
jgi:hypothetical protein